MRMDEMVTYLERRGFKAVKSYSAKEHAYEFTIERNGLKLADWFEYRGDGKTIWKAQKDFLDKLIGNFERLEKIEEREKNKMKNIAFDISRDGPVGKLVIKDNVYNVCVNQINNDRTPYNEKTYINLEVTSCAPIRNDITIGKNLFQASKTGMAVFYNPDRKDSINEGKVQIKDVIFNPPATIVFWSDGSKTVVKAENEVYDPEKGLAMAIAKRALGNQGNYFETFKKYVDPYIKKIIEEFNEIAEKYADRFSREHIISAKELKEAMAYTDGTERIAEPKKLYRIWYKSEDGTKTVYTKEYIKEGNAVRVARKIFAGTSTEWLVAREDPFKNGVWDKAFGSDS